MVGMDARRLADLDRFRDKIDRELKAGIVTVLLLLVIERTGPEYGYRLLKNIAEWSGGRLAFQEGTAYPLLQNMEKMGLVTTYWGDGTAGPPRKYYQITEFGRRALEASLDDYNDLTATVTEVIRKLSKEAKNA